MKCHLLRLTLTCSMLGAPLICSASEHAELATWLAKSNLHSVVTPSTQVIAFGEACHDVKQFMTLRNEVFKYLVQHAGVRVYAAETGQVGATAVDDYINGRGSMSPDVIAAVYFDKPYAESLALIEWMREFNDRAVTSRPIRFIGIDISGVGVGPASRLSVGAEAALAYLERVDAATANRLRKQLQSLLPYFAPLAKAEDFQIEIDEGDDPSSRRRADQTRELLQRGIESLHLDDIGDHTQHQLNDAERNVLTGSLTDILALLEANRMRWSRQTSPVEFEHAYVGIQDALAVDRNLRGYRLYGINNPQWSTIRDFVMAEKLKALLPTLRAEERIFLFAHNLHIEKNPVNGALMGTMLNADLEDSYVTIGTLSTGVCNPLPELLGLEKLANTMWRFINLHEYDQSHNSQFAERFDALIQVQKWEFSEKM